MAPLVKDKIKQYSFLMITFAIAYYHHMYPEVKKIFEPLGYCLPRTIKC